MTSFYSLSKKRLTASACIAGVLSLTSPAWGQTDTNSTGIDLDALLEMDLEKVLDIQSAGRGQVGSFGSRLSTGDNKVNVNGYVTNEYIDAQNGTSTYDNHYFNVLVGSQITKQVNAEIQLEYEHGGEVIQARYAQVDFKLHDAFVIRTGKFLVPINTFNEFLYPEYINKSISRPFTNRNITPTAWAEVGVQVRGQIKLGKKITPFYSIYSVNGLEGEAGADIRGMRNNSRDKNNDNKAFGGRLGFTSTFGLEAGAGVYNGKYTADGKDNLFISAFDAGYANNNLTLRAEVNMANIEATDTSNVQTDTDRFGGAFQASYIIKKHYEPVVRYDFIDYGDSSNPSSNKNRIYIGFNYLVSSTINIKTGYEIITNEGTDVDDNVFAVQFALGF